MNAVAIVATITFAALVLGLTLAYPRLRRRAELEEAEQILRESYETEDRS